MYLINIILSEAALNSGQAEQMLAQHRQWFGKYFERGHFLLLGPYSGKAAGVIVAQAESRDALQAILAEDVYYPDGAEYEVREFTANKIHPQIGDFAGR